LEIVLNVNSIKRTCCVAQVWAKFSSGTKYILLMNQVPCLEEEEEEEEHLGNTTSPLYTIYI
jgi:hypothetical protein